jgi:hypothetical protein
VNRNSADWLSQIDHGYNLRSHSTLNRKLNHYDRPRRM